jgi:hypothetical protein
MIRSRGVDRDPSNASLVTYASPQQQRHAQNGQALRLGQL